MSLTWRSYKELLALGFQMVEVCEQQFGRYIYIYSIIIVPLSFRKQYLLGRRNTLKLK